MAKLDMKGSCNLNGNEINSLFKKDGIISNYACGDIDPSCGLFVVKYVGKSDGDMRNRIKHCIGRYTKFKYSTTSSVKEAFEKECKNYHGFNPSGNNIHPDRPEGNDYKCPYCNKFN